MPGNQINSLMDMWTGTGEPPGGMFTFNNVPPAAQAPSYEQILASLPISPNPVGAPEPYFPEFGPPPEQNPGLATAQAYARSLQPFFASQGRLSDADQNLLASRGRQYSANNQITYSQSGGGGNKGELAGLPIDQPIQRPSGFAISGRPLYGVPDIGDYEGWKQAPMSMRAALAPAAIYNASAGHGWKANAAPGWAFPFRFVSGGWNPGVMGAGANWAGSTIRDEFGQIQSIGVPDMGAG